MCWMPYSRLRIRRLVQFVTTALRIDLLLQPATIVGVQPESLLVRKRCARNVAHTARDSRQSQRDEIHCRRCDSQLFSAARACGLYEGALRESVLLLKRQPHLSSHLRSLLVGAAQRAPLNSANRIIPVPLHSEKEERRGLTRRH